MTATLPGFARIPAGEFEMGSADGAPDERPVHRVHVSEFLIGRFPVSQGEYDRFVKATGYPVPAVRNLPLIVEGAEGNAAIFRDRAAPYIWHDGEPPPGRGTHPIVLVRFDDALAYCEWMSQSLSRVVRLPTEAEWEKAARGGIDGLRYPSGEDIDPSRANYLSDVAMKAESGTRAVGTYPANAYGLHDIAGNVWEWVSDWYSADAYAAADPRDPTGPPSGSMRVVRGGSWVNDDVGMLRCAYRHQVPPDTYAYSIGFRVVCPG